MKLKNIRAETMLVHGGRDSNQPGATVNTPVYRGSTLLFPTVCALESVHGTPYTYGRHGSPTTRALEETLCGLEGAFGAMLTPSGLSAITTTLLATLQPNDHLLMTDSVYDPTRAFCENTLRRLGIETTYYDPLAGLEIAKQMRPNTRVVFTESPGSLTFEVQDIPAICQVAHAHGAWVVLDNTWGTPINFRSFQHGVDVSIHAATKYIVGHSDVLMGAILSTQALYPTLRGTYKHLGLCVSPDDAYLALRGLRTLSSRLERHQHNASVIAKWLTGREEVQRVLYPVLPEAPGHDIWARDFTGACGLFGIVLKPFPKHAVTAMLNGMKLFGMGYSWGGFESLMIPIDPASHRTATVWKEQGPMLRLHIGLENANDLIADLDAGFERLRLAMNT